MSTGSVAQPTMLPGLILASTSPRRLELLRQIGVTPAEIVDAAIEESPMAGELPRQHATRLAVAKAAAVTSRLSAESSEGPRLVLAADTVVGVGRRILPKAVTDAQVRSCLELLSGRRHRVYTAVSLIHLPSGHSHQRLVESTVIFKTLSAPEIADYLTSGEGLAKAGGYAIQG
ncbi:MAG: Maf family protein, partial [Alphaproteobacteria bacterium]|nr:Maf family protein [Alphaproteobacteria bacterium]